MRRTSRALDCTPSSARFKWGSSPADRMRAPRSSFPESRLTAPYVGGHPSLQEFRNPEQLRLLRALTSLQPHTPVPASASSRSKEVGSLDFNDLARGTSTPAGIILGRVEKPFAPQSLPSSNGPAELI